MSASHNHQPAVDTPFARSTAERAMEASTKATSDLITNLLYPAFRVFEPVLDATHEQCLRLCEEAERRDDEAELETLAALGDTLTQHKVALNVATLLADPHLTFEQAKAKYEARMDRAIAEAKAQDVPPEDRLREELGVRRLHSDVARAVLTLGHAFTTLGNVMVAMAMPYACRTASETVRAAMAAGVLEGESEEQLLANAARLAALGDEAEAAWTATEERRASDRLSRRVTDALRDLLGEDAKVLRDDAEAGHATP